VIRMANISMVPVVEIAVGSGYEDCPMIL